MKSPGRSLSDVDSLHGHKMRCAVATDGFNGPLIVSWLLKVSFFGDFGCLMVFHGL